MKRTGVHWVVAAASVAGACVNPSLAQVSPPAPPTPGTAPSQPIPADDQAVAPQGEMSAADREKAMLAYNKRRVELDRELRKLRARHFGPIRKAEIRQEGILKLRDYSEPQAVPLMVQIFDREGPDVTDAVADHLASLKRADADTSLAWVSAHSTNEAFRAAATVRLKERIAEIGSVPDGVVRVVYFGLKSQNDKMAEGAALLAGTLDLRTAIPWLIPAQVSGGGGGSGEGNRTGDLAWIMIGTQHAFVSDLTPVVSQSAVGFDPTLSVLTEGTILRIQDAVVVTYRTIVHDTLVQLSTADWGQPTDGLGYDVPRWNAWYRDQYLPFLSARFAAQSEADSKRLPANTPAPPQPPPPGMPGQSPTKPPGK